MTDDDGKRLRPFTVLAMGACLSLALAAGCARQVRVESGPSDADTTDRDTSSLVVDAERIPAFEPPGLEAAQR